MVIYSTKPIKRVSKEDFFELIRNRQIIVSSHAIWHLNNKQRKVFNIEELLNMLKRENPRKVYLQENGRYSSYYRRNDGYRKLIIEIRKDKTIVVTFVDLKEIPKYNL